MGGFYAGLFPPNAAAGQFPFCCKKQKPRTTRNLSDRQKIKNGNRELFRFHAARSKFFRIDSIFCRFSTSASYTVRLLRLIIVKFRDLDKNSFGYVGIFVSLRNRTHPRSSAGTTYVREPVMGLTRSGSRTNRNQSETFEMTKSSSCPGRSPSAKSARGRRIKTVGKKADVLRIFRRKSRWEFSLPFFDSRRGQGKSRLMEALEPTHKFTRSG